MAKRGALTDLNHDNWDQEEPDEERGSFKRATDDELKKRVIKKAVRRTTTGSDGNGPAVFGNFTAFGKVEAKPATAAFSFLNSSATPSAGFKLDANKPVTSSAAASTSSSSFGFGSGATTTNTAIFSSDKKPVTSGSDAKYSADLKALNISFSKWVQQCVDKNPICILTPLFDDYKKFIKELEDEKKSGTTTPSNTSTEKKDSDKKNDDDKAPKAPKSNFTFGSALASSTATATSSTSTFTFGNLAKTSPANSGTTTTTTEASKPFSFGSLSSSKAAAEDIAAKPPASTGFSFGSAPVATTSSTSFTIPSFGATSTATSTPFSFGSAKPFSFGNVTQAPKADADDGGTKNEDDDDEEPPKVEFTPVVEEDSVYSKRCKVFVKVDKDYKDRGVGTLFIKNVQDGKKTQVLVRADTSLGNILLNALLTKEIPLKRMGKNNVMLPIMDQDKPTTALIRVKTAEDADELLENLEKNKK